ncbi:MAG: hypothetical protein IPK82_14890 [Polyangiaceae bacterium]|nr:hypothetical protein [Polyangiaceae bacterium]
MCPYCGQDAPIVYRGVNAFCTACGKQRPALIAPSVSYAGKPAKVGGTVAKATGWVVLVIGLCISLFLGLLFGAVGTFVGAGAWLGLAFGVPPAILTAVISTVLLVSGKKLGQSGAHKEKEMRRKALFALAQNRNGKVTADDASRSLGIPPTDANALLEELAKTAPEAVSLEVDDNGRIYYTFPHLLAAAPKQRIVDPRVRVENAADPYAAAAEEEAAEVSNKQQRRL